MAGGTIRMDYSATMQAAKRLGSVNDLVGDAQSRQHAIVSDLKSWEGAAASKAKVTVAKVSDVLKSYQSAYWQFARFFVNAAEKLTGSDEAAAKSMNAKWD